MSPVQVTHFRCAKKDQRTDLPVLNSSEKPVWIIISWAACLSWGTGLTTSAFPWLKAHSPNTWPDHFTLLKTKGTDSHRTLFCTGRNLFRNCPCLLYYQVVTNIFFYPIADCISIFHRAECFWTRTFSHGAPAIAYSHKFDCCPLRFSRVVLAMELPLHRRLRQWNWTQNCFWGLCGEGSHYAWPRGLHSQVCWDTDMFCVCLLPSPVTGTNNGAFGTRLWIDFKYSRWCNFLEVAKFLFWTQKGHSASATGSSICKKKKLLVENTLDSLQHLYGKPLMHHVPHTWNSTIPAVN